MRKAIIIAIVIVITVIAALAFKKQETDNKNKLTKTMTITSPAFEHNGTIPQKYTCDGENISPEFRIEGVPKEAKSLALIMDDPDAPRGTFTHWLVYNMDPRNPGITENAIPIGLADENEPINPRAPEAPAALEGMNGTGRVGYIGPCPPSGTHRYFFKLFALDAELNIPNGAERGDLERAMEGHVLASSELIGLYERKP